MTSPVTMWNKTAPRSPVNLQNHEKQFIDVLGHYVLGRVVMRPKMTNMPSLSGGKMGCHQLRAQVD